MDNYKKKIFKDLGIKDIQMSSTEILCFRNYIPMTVIFQLQVLWKSVSLKITVLKLAKLDFLIT